MYTVVIRKMRAIAMLLFVISLAALMTHGAQHDVDQQPLIIPAPPSSTLSPGLDLTLKHIFHRGAHKFPRLHRRLDIDDSTVFAAASGGNSRPHAIPQHSVKQRSITIERLADRPSASSYHLLNAQIASDEARDWAKEEVAAPDVSDRETVLSFARMALDAYTLEPGEGNWQDVGMGFNYTEHFGWENDGLRGHVFADKKNQTVVIAMKGTSLPFIDPIGTIGNDKVNDNLMFSCCCGQGGRWLWHQVCSCQTDTKVCNGTCLAKEMREKTRYYFAAQELFFNISKIYPNADVWLTGHSLGGSIASLVGLFVGQPVVTFEAPAEAMAAARLGLARPPRAEFDTEAHNRGSTGGYHFGHTADDIFMGNCNAWNSICTLGGYAMETKCHTGHECVYDTVKDKGWSPNARHYHSIEVVLKEVFEDYRELPECKVRTKCTDCEDWDYTTQK